MTHPTHLPYPDEVLRVMLEANPSLAPPLSQRDPERTCFALLTPEILRRHPESRLYGWLLPRYRARPNALADDLSHRRDVDWPSVSRRLGWLTFEDCANSAVSA